MFAVIYKGKIWGTAKDRKNAEREARWRNLPTEVKVSHVTITGQKLDDQIVAWCARCTARVLTDNFCEPIPYRWVRRQQGLVIDIL